MPVHDNYQFSSFFAKGHYETQVETVEVLSKEKGITIGVPKERNYQESRVALVPNSIRSIVGYGHSVIVERQAGEASSFTDEHFVSAGAEVTEDQSRIYNAEILIKSSPPSIDELELMSEGQLLITPLQLPLISEGYIKRLKEKRITAIAMEHLTYEDGSFPVIRIMSEIAGRMAILTAAELLCINRGGRGVLLGGVSGVPPAKVVILGAGVVGSHASTTALSLGASIRIFDNDIYKLVRLQKEVGQQLHTSSLNPEYLAYQLTSADVVIGCMHSKTGRSPILVTDEMVQNMKRGSVIIDVSIDQGGCFETSQMTTHAHPTYIKHGVTHYCVPNIASKVARTSSMAISNILTPLILRLGNANTIKDTLYQSAGIRNAVYGYCGHITNEYLAKRFNVKYTALELLLTSAH
ncbi:MAG: alanine dehydrogenase [Bacteroidota bacterium]